MTSCERMLEYTDLPQEPPLVSEGGGSPPDGWPSSGALVFEGVSAVYRPGLPPVLQDISFELKVREWGRCDARGLLISEGLHDRVCTHHVLRACVCFP